MPSQKMIATITLRKTNQSFLLTNKPVTIGRQPDNTIVLSDDLRVSRYHATIFFRAGNYVIEDLNSSNGTFLNGQLLKTPHILRNGDLINVGSTEFMVHIPKPEPVTYEFTNLAQESSLTEHVLTLGQEPITIGRKGDNTIVLAEDPNVSRYHALIMWQQKQHFVEDLSANGTYLNNKRVSKRQPVRAGDRLRVGNNSFIIQIHYHIEEPPSLLPMHGIGDEFSSSQPIFNFGDSTDNDDNPYVGPRTFRRQEGDRFFGREAEARELLSLVISERLVLFYAQSGAGKSSLINARLIPQLQEAGFAVLPVGRISGDLPEGIKEPVNIFIFNLLLSLDESDSDPKYFINMILNDFLDKLTSPDGEHYYYDDQPKTQIEITDYTPRPYVLIIDQFEEIITTHPSHWQQRENFFEQLNQAMLIDPNLWVVLSLREDYIATLEPYAHLMSDKMRARFYMQRMSYEAALKAVKQPASLKGWRFATGAAEILVDNLRQIRLHNQRGTQPGQFVEPVQLQIVCRQLWENLPDQPAGVITEQHLLEAGDVDSALADFYEQVISRTLHKIDVPEHTLRRWFDEHLITEANTRGIVYQGVENTAGLPNKAVRLLADQYLIRAEIRAGGTWYELVHDRFVEPIVEANRSWWMEQSISLLKKAMNKYPSTMEASPHKSPLKETAELESEPKSRLSWLSNLLGRE